LNFLSYKKSNHANYNPNWSKKVVCWLDIIYKRAVVDEKMRYFGSEILIFHEVVSKLLQTLVLKVKRNCMWVTNRIPKLYLRRRVCIYVFMVGWRITRVVVLINYAVDRVALIVKKLWVLSCLIWDIYLIVNNPGFIRNFRLTLLVKVIEVIWLTYEPRYCEVGFEVFNLWIRIKNLGSNDICSIVDFELVPEAYNAGASKRHLEEQELKLH